MCQRNVRDGGRQRRDPKGQRVFERPSPASYDDQVIAVVQNSSLFDGIDDMKGTTFGTMSGANAAPLLTSKFAEMGFSKEIVRVVEDDNSHVIFDTWTLLQYPTYQELSDALEEGTVDAIYQSKAQSIAFMADNDTGYEATDAKMREYRELLGVDNVLIVRRDGSVVRLHRRRGRGRPVRHLRPARRRAPRRGGAGRCEGGRPAHQPPHRQEGRRALGRRLHRHHRDLVLHADAVRPVLAVAGHDRARRADRPDHQDQPGPRLRPRGPVQRALPLQGAGRGLHPRPQPRARHAGEAPGARRRAADRVPRRHLLPHGRRAQARRRCRPAVRDSHRRTVPRRKCPRQTQPAGGVALSARRMRARGLRSGCRDGCR